MSLILTRPLAGTDEGQLSWTAKPRPVAGRGFLLRATV